MKKCVEATSKPQMEWDHKLKREFDSCLNETTEEMSQELGNFATISDSEKQRMAQLVKKAARLWLEVGQQRCRMSRSCQIRVRIQCEADVQLSTAKILLYPRHRLGPSQVPLCGASAQPHLLRQAAHT